MCKLIAYKKNSMKFVKIQKSNSNIIECTELNNDVLVRRINLEIYNHIQVRILDKQYAILIEKGEILAVCSEAGDYEIDFDLEDNSASLKKWKLYKDEKTKTLPLSLVFINLKEITENKFYFKKPIEYVDWTNCYYDENLKQKLPLKTQFIGDGKFNFIIENPVLFLNSILGIREHYTKQELLEQIRKIVVNSIKLGIDELGEEYKLSIKLVKNKSNELEIRVSQNNYDEKLAKRGIKITYFEITNFEELNQSKTDNSKNNFEKLFLQLYKASKNPEFIEAKNITVSINEEGEIIAKRLDNICKRCGSLIESEDKYCKNCGAKVTDISMQK